MTRTPFTVLIVMLLAAPAAFAQGRRGQPPQPPQTAPAASESAPRVETAGEKEEKISQTSHTVRLDGREIKYTATAGTLTDDETESVGLALMNLQETIADLARQFDIDPSELNLDLGPVGKLL